ncbi:signal peptide protein, YSIRK family [Ancylostoma caninum]|uniref:Signal peptide protein, YSIRK family n=1 Tax=Ancylostoma caninum TaxID=29170 RepID=A0A368GKK3_ANCCA|nr:signal peptide protein, YSIRK family [Ancylostoma caninum]
MSILSEILSTGHVDKELLDALDDAQKQLLFCQMRAEQVRFSVVVGLPLFFLTNAIHYARVLFLVLVKMSRNYP